MTFRPSALAAAVLLLTACGGGTRSPICGIALVTAPTLIHEQLKNARAIITDVPRGLPESLPARFAGNVGDSGIGVVKVSYAEGRRSALALGYEGRMFPAHRDGFALLVVDDTSNRAEGVMLYDVEGPDSTVFPLLGHISSTELNLPVYGVTVNYAGMSNPRCPLLGFPPPAARPTS